VYATALGHEKLANVTFTVRILQVTRKDVLEFIDFLRADAFDIVIMLGVSAKETDVKIEVLGKRILVQDGNELDYGSQFPPGPDTLLSTTYLGHPLMINYQKNLSFNAGNYFCNELYYRTLLYLYLQADKQCSPALFLHVPPLHKMSIEAGIRVILDILQKICKIHFNRDDVVWNE
jgi:pyrrolidone-carboxylate peptidase